MPTLDDPFANPGAQAVGDRHQHDDNDHMHRELPVLKQVQLGGDLEAQPTAADRADDKRRADVMLPVEQRVRPLTIGGVAHQEPHMSNDAKGKRRASYRGTVGGAKPADNARNLPARREKWRYPCDLC